MIAARFVPIAEWPGKPTPPWEQGMSPFSAKYNQTLDLLEYELGRLGARDVLIQAYLKREDIRNDGWPRADARPSRPGVIVSFDVPQPEQGGKRINMAFPCDRFNRMEDNIRAIAKSLEALRMVDRYGVTRNSEQYRGFAQLLEAKAWTVDESAAFLEVKTGIPAHVIVHFASNYRAAYREAAKSMHPDQGGNPHEWKLLQDAKALLDLHHGLGPERTA